VRWSYWQLLLRFLPVVLVSMSLFLLSGCEGERGALVRNSPPGIEIVYGPIEGGMQWYRVVLAWNSWDKDGLVDHFLWAVDDTLSEDDWTVTYVRSDTFYFPATTKGEPDSSLFYDLHTFYIKAVDDQGAQSPADYVSFNAYTYAPSTQITNPAEAVNSFGQPVGVGAVVKVGFAGTDPDGPNQRPVGYYYRKIPLPIELAVHPELILKAVADSAAHLRESWAHLPSDSTEVTLTDLVEPGEDGQKLYAFCVKAADEAGAIEPYFIFGKNVIVVQASSSLMGPVLVLGVEGYGAAQCSGGECPVCEGDGWDLPLSCIHGPLDLPAAAATFYWQASAERYGGMVSGYRYGLDVTDPTDPSQWSVWSMDTTVTYRFTREDATDHSLYVQSTDDLGDTSMCRLDFEIVAYDFDKAVLFVDDLVNTHQFGPAQSIDPTDEQQDTYWRELFAAAGLVEGTDDGFTMFEGWNYAEPEKRESYVPSLEEISRYRAVIWLTSPAWGNYTALCKTVGDPEYPNILSSYINGGGRFWLLGQGSIRVTGCMSSTYPITLYSGGLGSFVEMFLHIRNTRVDAPLGSESGAMLAGARSALYPFPDLSLDVLPGGRFEFAYDSFRGISSVEAIIDPMNAAGVDTLYRYVAVDSLEAQELYGKPCGIRWDDPDLASKVAWFGFPLYWFEQQQAEEVVKIMLQEMLAP